MSTSATQPAPRFERGQRVRIIANQGGLYAAQIGVVGVIERKRQYRHWGYHTYEVGYQDAKGRDKLLSSVREDDLEGVSEADKPTSPDVLFCVGDRVVVRTTLDEFYDGSYPTFATYPAVGKVISDGYVTSSGVAYHDVRFPKSAKSVQNEVSDYWPAVTISAAHLIPAPAHLMTPTKPAKSAKAPETPPLFAKGDHVTVDQHSALAYETFTRKGAVGVITEIGKPVRGIRRYTVRYSTGVMTRIREEHLVKAEMPAPPEPHQQPVIETAYVERSDGELVKREQTMLFPTPPEPAPQPHPWPTPEELEQRRAAAREREQQQMAALLALSPHEAARWLAKWLITTDVQRGYTEQMIALGHEGYSGSLGNVNVESGRIVRVSRIGPHPAWTATGDYPAGYDHKETFSLHALYQELRVELFEPAKPQQMSLWG